MEDLNVLQINERSFKIFERALKKLEHNEDVHIFEMIKALQIEFDLIDLIRGIIYQPKKEETKLKL